MKKVISLLLVILMLTFTVSCENSDIGEIDTSSVQDTLAQESTLSTEAQKEKYNGIFRVGFGRVDITPELPIVLESGETVSRLLDNIYATCVAVSDGETTALIYSVDVKDIFEDFDKTLKRRIKQETGIPMENIMINAMHNHSVPCPGINKTQNNIKWNQNLHKWLAQAGADAIADLSDATISIGVGKTTGINYVRRYMHADGTMSGIMMRHKSSTPYVSYESKADDDVQVIRFSREDKKDIVIANWQAHPAHAIGHNPDSLTSDYIHYMRKAVESGNDDLLFAYYLGAAGNINFNKPIKDDVKASYNYIGAGRTVGKTILETLDKMTPVEAGKVEASTMTYKARKRDVTEDELARAKAVNEAGYSRDSAEYNALLDKYDLQSYAEVGAILNRNSRAEIQDMLLGVITFGDIAFSSIPYEMFDTNGMELKEGSPYEMTFVLAYTGGMFSYVPSANSVPNKGYEVYMTRFEFGTGEKVVEALLGMLKEVKNTK